MKTKFLMGALLMAATMSQAAEESLVVTSPEGVNKIEVVHVNDGVQYSVTHDGQQVIANSRLGLEMDNEQWEHALAQYYTQYSSWMQGFSVDSVSYSQHREMLHPLYGERKDEPDKYNAGTIYLSKKDKSNYRLNIEVRAYEEGVAFRYYFPEHPVAVYHKVVGDLTDYTFAEGTKVWCAEWSQAPYELKDVNDVKKPIERVVTVALPNGLCAALGDADCDDWCVEANIASKTKRNTLETVMHSPVDVVTYAATPWKVILTGKTYGELLEHRYIIDNLNEPCQIPDASEWVKPGKSMRCVTLTTQGCMDNIDFCKEHNIDYLLICWKWYLPVTSFDGDATKARPEIDMPKVLAYAKEKGIKVWLYINQHAMMKQAKELLPLYKKWGVVGVKPGFVEYRSHRWATWLHDFIRLAAENKLMVNIHDEYRPTGFSRTYPNLLTAEGIRGNEEFPSATHNVTLPFTRMINGPGDYTFCYYNGRLKNTHAHQLAAALVFYSPINALFWYDTPKMAHGEPELKWFDNLPTTWDNTKVLSGVPAEHIVMAREKDGEWYVGAMTNDEARTVIVNPADFLTAGKWEVTSYTDDPTVDTKTHVAVKKQIVIVKASKKGLTAKPIVLDLQAKGGAALHFKAITK